MGQHTNIVIPWRDSGDAWRKRSCDHVARHMLFYPFIFADDGSEPFSRSGSKNLGAASCTDDVVMFLDSDTIIPHSQIDEAFELARQGYVVHPYTHYHAMNAQASMDIYDGKYPSGDDSEWNITWATGGATVIPMELFNEIGRFDEGYIDWGFEDISLLIAARNAGAEVKRVEGNCYHLWHPRAPENDQMRANAEKYRREYLKEG